jgi:hypothetical protein
MTKPKPKEEPDDLSRFLSEDADLHGYRYLAHAYIRLPQGSRQIARAGIIRYVRTCRSLKINIGHDAIVEIINDAKLNRRIYAEEAP